MTSKQSIIQLVILVLSFICQKMVVNACPYQCWCSSTTSPNLCTSCISGYYYYSNSCTFCSSYCHYCASSSACSTCFETYGLLSGKCVSCTKSNCSNCNNNANICNSCKNKFGFNTSEIVPNNYCYSCIQPHCYICRLDFQYCQSCQPGYGVTPDKTCLACNDSFCSLCPTNYEICNECKNDDLHGMNNQTCPECDSLCKTCKYTNNLLCKSCHKGYFLVGQECFQCADNCSQCVSLTNCTDCFDQFYQQNGLCKQCPEFYKYCSLNISLNEVQCEQPTDGGQFDFYSEAVTICVQLCGDSYTKYYLCDNEKNISYDGCDDECKVDDEFVCNVSDIGVTECSYDGDFVIEQINFERFDWENRFSMQLKVYPFLAVFNSMHKTEFIKYFDFQSDKIQLLDINFDPKTMIFTFNASFSDDLVKDEQLSIRIMQSLVSDKIVNFDFHYGIYPPYFYSSFEFTMANIIFLMGFVTCILGWVSFIIGIFTRKLAGLEAMFVLQLYWLMFFWNSSSFLYLPFGMIYPLKYTSGYNHIFIKENIQYSFDPPFVKQFQISPNNIINSFNFSLAFVAIPMLFLLITFIRLSVYKHVHQIQDGAQYKSFNDLQNQNQLSCEISMKGCMITLLYFVNYLIVLLKHSTFLNSLNASILGTFGFFIVLLFVYFFRDLTSFGCFYSSFKQEALAVHNYFFQSLTLVLSVLILGFLQNLSFLALIPNMGLVIMTLIYKPYLLKRDNIRSAINYGVICSFFIFKIFVQYLDNQQKSIRLKLFLYVFVNSVIILPSIVIIGCAFSTYGYFYERFLIPLFENAFNLQKMSKKMQKTQIFSEIVQSNGNAVIKKEKKIRILKDFLPNNKSLKQCSNALNYQSNRSQEETGNGASQKTIKENRKLLQEQFGKFENIKDEFGDNFAFYNIEDEYENENEEQRIMEFEAPKNQEQNIEKVVEAIVKDSNQYLNLKVAMKICESHIISMNKKDQGAREYFLNEYDNIGE